MELDQSYTEEYLRPAISRMPEWTREEFPPIRACGRQAAALKLSRCDDV